MRLVNKHRKIKKILIVLLWLLCWQSVAALVGNPIYFAGPAETLGEFMVQVRSTVFLQSVAGSLIRIAGGFFAAAVCAYLMGFLVYFVPSLEDFFSPAVQFLKSVPVAAVTVVLLLWWGSSRLVLCISFMVVFPNVYQSMLTGLRKTDSGLLEMAEVFHVRLRDRFLWLYRPAYLAHLKSALCFSIGMAFKSGVAAEIIGLPKYSIGEQLYREKIYLNTPGVFSWIVVILLLSAMAERIMLLAVKRLSEVPTPVPVRIKTQSPKGKKGQKPSGIYVRGIKKAYGEKRILDADIALEAGKIYHLSGVSGSGKTTLLHILAGIIRSDEGEVLNYDLRMVFQEDRLVMQANALRNLAICGCVGNPGKEMEELLSGDRLLLPAGRLSGGERRRISIARAVLTPSDMILMDEPFNGLDAKNRIRAASWIKDRQNGRTILVVSHDETDAELMGAQKLFLKEGKILKGTA